MYKYCLFFDGNNFYKGMQKCKPDLVLDYRKLAQDIGIELGESIRSIPLFNGAYYYTGLGKNTGDLNKFLEGLKMQPGYFVRTRKRKPRSRICPHCKKKILYSEEKEIDTLMVSEMIKLAAEDAFDIAVIFSGDSDLVPAAESLRSLGKRVVIATWGGQGLSNRLIASAFSVIDLIKLDL